MNYLHWRIVLGAITFGVFLYLTMADSNDWIPKEVEQAPMFALVAATALCVSLIQGKKPDETPQGEAKGNVLDISLVVDLLARVLIAVASWVAAMKWLQETEFVPPVFNGLAIVLGLVACTSLVLGLFAGRNHGGGDGGEA